MKSNSNKGKHLTLEERRIILKGIENGSDKASIAKTIGKDKSTISKEIKKHRVLAHKNKMALDCNNYRHCKLGRNCKSSCPSYSPFKCSRRDRSPGACNGCSIYNSCHFDKYRYNPEVADNDYKTTLVDSRLGVNLTFSEAKAIGDAVKPLLDKGLSPYVIVKEHPELGICEKTLYNYIESGILQAASGTTVLDLRRQPSRKIRKKQSSVYKKRKDKKYLHGRMYKDYLEYISLNPDVFVTQMDTVYNDETNGPFIQTFKLMSGKFLFAIFHESKTASDMLKGIDILEETLGSELFERHCHIILTDRGTEFTTADAAELRPDGSRRTRIFYCDPMQSGQKGSLENNHELLRYIFPKGTDLRELGLVDQESLNIALSNINSYPVEFLGGRSPIQYTKFLFPDLWQKLNEFGIEEINVNDVVLKPYLLKNRRR
jgi:IS30 family transposase